MEQRSTIGLMLLHLGNVMYVCMYVCMCECMYVSIYLPMLSTLCFNLVLEALGGCGWRPPPILKSDWRGFGPIALRCWRWGRPIISIVSVWGDATILSRGGACWQGSWWDNTGRGVASGWGTIVSDGNWCIGKRRKKMNSWNLSVF